jgi:hypothetical protein
VFTHVIENNEATTALAVATATAPSVSGDGALVVASTGSSNAQRAIVTLLDRTATPLAPVDLGPGSLRAPVRPGHDMNQSPTDPDRYYACAFR